MTALIPIGIEQAKQAVSAPLHGRTSACHRDPEAWFATDLAARRLGLAARRLGRAARWLRFAAGRRRNGQPLIDP
jgi:hypothetical protein